MAMGGRFTGHIGLCREHLSCQTEFRVRYVIPVAPDLYFRPYSVCGGC